MVDICIHATYGFLNLPTASSIPLNPSSLHAFIAMADTKYVPTVTENVPTVTACVFKAIPV